jgi:hypothetical protein
MALAPTIRRALPVLASAGAALTGCFSDRGLAIEIDVGGTGAASVELFLGKTACDAGGDHPDGIDCKSIAPPPSGSAPLRGSIWFRDDLAVDSVQVTGPRVTFQLRSDTAVTVPIVIAVGLTQGDHPVGVATLHDVTIPAGSARVLATTLVPAGAVQATAPAKAAVEDRVQVWRKTTPPSSCVVAEHWEGGAATRSFVVPSSDPDCDDVVDECDPAAYLAMEPPGAASRPDCFATQLLPQSQAQACVLGSHACTDGSAIRTGECGAQHDTTICVPDRFCLCTSIGDACWQDQLRAMPALVPFIDCSIATTQSAPITACPGQDTATIPLDGHFSQDDACGNPTIASSSLLGFGSSASFGGAEVELSSPRKPCTFSLTWKSGTRTSGDPADIGAIRIPTTTGELLLPLMLHFHPTPNNCVGPQVSCMVMDVPTDGVWTCAR